MTGERTKEWVKQVSLAEYWYNTNYHSFAHTTPFEIVYAQPPNLHLPYIAGTSSLEEVDRTMQDREQVIAMLHFHLNRSQNRIKSMADKHRSDRNFEVGMKVYLKLQPYRQSTVRQGTHHKFAAKYYRPCVVIAKVGKVLSVEPEAIIGKRLGKLNKKVVLYVLVKWVNQTEEEATWELYTDLIQRTKKINNSRFRPFKSLSELIQEGQLHTSLGERPSDYLPHAQSEYSNELFQKLLKDLHIVNKELAEYINSPSWDHPTFFICNEEHSVQYKEYLENPSNEIAASNFNQEKEKPQQDFNIRQLIREECFIKVCRKQKQNMKDTMLELVEVCHQKEFYYMHNDVDDLIESALNSKLLSINLESQRLNKKKQEVKNIVEQPTKRETRINKSLKKFRVKKSSISFNNTSQISPVHAITPVLPTEEPDYSLSMGEYEVTSDDESECDVPIKDESSLVFTTFSNPLFNDNDDFTSSDDESLFKEDFDYLKEFSCALIPTSIADEERIRREHEEYISLMERLFTINPCPRPMENSNTIVETLPSSPIPLEDKGDIHFLEELLVDDSIPIPENDSFYFYHHDDLLFPRPPLEPSDVEFFFDSKPKVISAVMNNNDELNEDECFDPGGKIDVSTNVENDD
nr:retrotransposable element Tf2 [Tanacetum cinerariifolium]